MKGIKPIIIIGAARSGTTLLGEILSRHSQLAFWLEPKYIWRFGDPGRTDDVRRAEDCTPAVKRYIKGRFGRFVERSKKDRLLEKTPSNCFRIGFINEIYPDAQFVHLIRDGRKVAVSAEKKWTSIPDGPTLMRRFTNMEIPVLEWPHYSMAVLRDVIGRRLFPQKGYIWGPHFPGIRQFRNNHSVIETCAEQWRQSVNYAKSQLQQVSGSRTISVHYEELCDNPGATIEKILDFLELDQEDLAEYATNYIKRNDSDYTLEDTRKMVQIEPLIKEELKMLGYHVK